MSPFRCACSFKHLTLLDFDVLDEDDKPIGKGRDLDRVWMMSMLSRAAKLWRGRQVDGSVWEWKRERDGVVYHSDNLEMETAVCAGWRYLTSLASTPRYLRTSVPMHPSLFARRYSD